jgi:hypothetical protein
MKSIFLLCAICLLAIVGQAQVLKELGGELKQDAKWKVQSKANQKMDQALDTLLSQPKKIKRKQKTKADEIASAEKSSQVVNQTSENNENKSVISSNESTQVNGIIGDWKLVLETYDNNHNHALDDDERKKGFANHYFYRFSSNGSCLISAVVTNQVQSAFKGHYEIKDENGRKKLTTYWDEAEQKGQREAQYTIISVNKDELVLLESVGDHTFWIFKRVG